MTFDDWILALHVLSAVAYGTGIILFWVLVVAVRTTDTADGTLRLAPTVMIGNIAIGIGAGGTIIFGVWLALSVRNYDLWDGWIIAALVLWVIAAILGQRTGKEYMRGMTKAQELQSAGQTGANAELLALNRTQAGVLLHALTSLVFLLIVLDMIWKPGRMTVLALMRPDSWNFPLLVHIVGVVVLVGGVVTAASLLGFAKGDTRLLRLGYWTLLAVALPGYIVLRVGGEWIYSKEGWDDLPEGVDDPAWLSIGYIVADLGALLLLASLIIGGIGVRRLGDGKGTGLLKATLALSIVIIAAGLVAVWAMAGKPN